MLAVTWPEGNQKMRLALEDGRVIESIDLENDGKSFHLAILDAPGIWHREELKPSYLHKDVAIGWERPFPATSAAAIRCCAVHRELETEEP